MKVLKRTQFGDPILRQKARSISSSEIKKPSFQNLVKQMFYTMRQAKGVGLAAPQVDKPLQLAVMQIKPNKVRPDVVPMKKTVMINPKILSKSKKLMSDWEGCLSFGKVRGLVPRHAQITVEYLDEKGHKERVNLKGFQARVFQHEIDHLNGVLYVDRIKDIKTLITLAEFKKRVLKKGLKSK